MGDKIMAQAAIFDELMESHRKRWTRQECRRLVEMGLLDGREFELIDGEIIYKLGQNEPHAVACRRALFALAAIFGEDFMRVPAPIAIDQHNEPEPDVAVAKDPSLTYLENGTPEPKDMRLIVEVSDSTLSWDRGRKAGIYNDSGVAEYWILNIKGRTAIVHRQPGPDGYGSIVTFGEDETISPLAAPDANLRVGDLLPAKTTKDKPKRTAARK